jgi:hypothetical protein
MDHWKGSESKALDQTTALLAPGTSFTELRPKPAQILLGKALGALVSVAGAVVLVGVFGMGVHPLWPVLGLGLLLAGGSMFWLIGRLGTLRILVSPNGFTMATLGRGNSCRCYRVGPAESPDGCQNRLNTLLHPGQSRLWEWHPGQQGAGLRGSA